MTTTRRYHFACSGADLEQAKGLLTEQCRLHHWFEQPYVVAGGFGFTVHARDQWRCHTRAMSLALAVCEALRLDPADMSDPLWTAPEPHSNRGYYRVQTP